MKKAFLAIPVILVIFLFSNCTPNEIDTSVKAGNDGFVLGNGSVGVVLTHGLGASPYEVKGLAEYLAARNMTVYVVRLPGHGTSVEDLSTKTWQDWYNEYRLTYLSVKQVKSKVFVGGMSLGGAIALKLAEDENVDGVVALAPALVLEDTRTQYAWLFKYFVKYSSRVIPQDRVKYYYDKFPVASVDETLKLSKIVEDNLGKINQPLLLMQYSNDTRASPESSQIVYDSVESPKKELDWINGTGHVFLLDDGKEKYFEKIYEFIKANS